MAILGIKGFVPWRILIVYFMLSVSQELPVGAFSAIMYKEMNLSPTKVMSYYMLCYTPWLLRPVYGFISDQFPIFRYRRKPYLTLHSAFGVAVFICLSLFGDQFSVFQILSVVNAGLIAFCEVMVDGLAVELSNRLKRELEARDALNESKSNEQTIKGSSSFDGMKVYGSPVVRKAVSTDSPPETKIDLGQPAELEARTQGSVSEVTYFVGGIDSVTSTSKRELLGKSRTATDTPSREIFNPALCDASKEGRNEKLGATAAIIGSGEALLRGIGQDRLKSAAASTLEKIKRCFGCSKGKKQIVRIMRVRRVLKKSRIPKEDFSSNSESSDSIVLSPLAHSQDEEALLAPSISVSSDYGAATSEGEILEFIDDGSLSLPADDEEFTYTCISEEQREVTLEVDESDDPMDDATPESICALVQAECMFVRSAASLVAAGLSVVAMYLLSPRKVLLMTAISPLVTAFCSFFIPDQKVGVKEPISAQIRKQREIHITSCSRSSSSAASLCGADEAVDEASSDEELDCCMESLLTNHVPHSTKKPHNEGETKTDFTTINFSSSERSKERKSVIQSPQVMASRLREQDCGPGPLGRISATSSPTATSVSPQVRGPSRRNSPSISTSPLLASSQSSSSAALLNIVSPTSAVAPRNSVSILDAHKKVRKLSTSSPSQQIAFINQNGVTTQTSEPTIVSHEPRRKDMQIRSERTRLNSRSKSRSRSRSRSRCRLDSEHSAHAHTTDSELPFSLEGHVGRLHGGVSLIPDCTEKDLNEHPDDESRWEAGMTGSWSHQEGQKCSCGDVEDDVGAFAGHESLCSLILCVFKQRVILLIRAVLLLLKPMLFVFIVYSMPSASTPYESFLYKKFSFANWFLTMLSYFALLGGLLGSLVYWRVLAKRSLPIVFCVTTIGSALIATPVQYLISRGDLKDVTGISMSVFLPITSFFTSIITRIALMPTIVLAATNCPSNLGLESTMFSLFASVSHGASFVSYWFSVEVTNAFNVNEDDYTDLPKLVLVCHGLALVPLLFLPLVIPGCLPLPTLPKALRIAGIDDETGVLDKLDELERARIGTPERESKVLEKNSPQREILPPLDA